jgi:hypothetical protein
VGTEIDIHNTASGQCNITACIYIRHVSSRH